MPPTAARSSLLAARAEPEAAHLAPGRDDRSRTHSSFARGFGRLAVGVVVEPRADHERPELRLRPEAERLVERLCIVCLKPDVLARHLVEQAADHRGRDSSSPVRSGRPDVDEVGVADAVRKQRATPTRRSPSRANATCWDCSKDRRRASEVRPLSKSSAARSVLACPQSMPSSEPSIRTVTTLRSHEASPRGAFEASEESLACASVLSSDCRVTRPPASCGARTPTRPAELCGASQRSPKPGAMDDPPETPDEPHHGGSSTGGHRALLSSARGVPRACGSLVASSDSRPVPRSPTSEGPASSSAGSVVATGGDSPAH